MTTRSGPGRTPVGRATGHRPRTGQFVVRRLVEDVFNEQRLEVIDENYVPWLAPAAHRWIEPFLQSFTAVDVRVVELLTDRNRVVAHLSCSGTHVNTWLGHPGTGRRFRDIQEVYFFTITQGRIHAAWGLEDTWSRLRQLGLASRATHAPEQGAEHRRGVS